MFKIRLNNKSYRDYCR